MEGSGKYGLGHENRIFDNPSFTLERTKKRKNVSKAMKIDIRDVRITGHVGSEKKKNANHQEKYNNMFIQNSTAQRRRLLLAAACFP